jgi:cell division protein ZapA
MGDIQIRIKIAEKEYMLKTAPQDEALLRQAAKLLNDRIKDTQKRTGIWDKQDLLAVVAFDGMVEQLKLQRQTQGQIEQVDALSDTLKKTLGE